MIKPDQTCRIVDAPTGEYHPTADHLNKLVRAIEPMKMPTCCLGCVLNFIALTSTDGTVWEVEALQHIPEFSDGAHTVPPGGIIAMPEKNLAPLPDLDDEKEILRDHELTA